jgi:hypothetical protein
MSEICNLPTLYKWRERALGAYKTALMAAKNKLCHDLPLTRTDLTFALLCLVTLGCCLPLLGPLKIRVEPGPLIFKCSLSLFLLALMIIYRHRALGYCFHQCVRIAPLSWQSTGSTVPGRNSRLLRPLPGSGSSRNYSKSRGLPCLSGHLQSHLRIIAVSDSPRLDPSRRARPDR